MSRPPSTDSPLSTDEARHVVAFAGVDPKTLRTYLSGARRTYRHTAVAIEKALRRIKRPELVRSADPGAAA